MKFKVGDRVRSRQPDQKYTGTIILITDKSVVVKRDCNVRNQIGKDFQEWFCRITNGKVATAAGAWDGISYLEKIKETFIYT
jgi:hypothetical protein